LKEELIDKISKSNPTKVKYYLDVFDRVLLQSVVFHVLDVESIKKVLDLCDRLIRSEINLEVTNLTKLMKETDLGVSLAQLKPDSDGESLRLSNIEAAKIAREVANYNYLNRED